MDEQPNSHMSLPTILAPSTPLGMLTPDGGIIAIMVLFGLLCFGFFIWMIVDCATNEPDEGSTKVVWLLVILLAPFGPLIYFIVRKLPRGKPRT
jgi:hypothetical protein